MRALRGPLTALLGLVLVFDVLTVYRLWLYRPWKTMVPSSEGPLGQLAVAATWTGLDFLILGLLVAFQIGLAHLVCRSWRSKPQA